MSEINFTPSGPVVKAWMEDDSFVRVLIGPVGSGKTAGACVEILRRSMAQEPGPDGIRRTRWAIIRNTFAMLKSTTLKSWEQWCPRTFGKLTIGGSPIVHRIQAPGLDIEVMFLPLDTEEDVSKLLSLEITGAWIDECREIPKGVLDVLTTRVGRYPSRLQGGCTWRGILLTSNPSDTEHWLHKVFSPTDPGVKIPKNWVMMRQPSGRSPEAENIHNLPKDYYLTLMEGKDAEFVKVYVDGLDGFLIEGQVVYPSFRDSVHVPQSPVLPLPGIPLVLGADWGLTPACAICQQWPDGRILVVDEFVCDDSGIIRFADSLTAFMKQRYPDFQVSAAIGDPAGTSRGPDERTIFEIMNSRTPWRWKPAGTNDPTLRIEAVSAFLNRMVDGKPGFMLNPGCGVLRKGFAGGYCFAKVATSGSATYHESPKKNQYSHPHDALQYAVLGMGGSDLALNRETRRNRSRVAEGMDDPVFGPTTPGQGTGVVWGDARPKHLGPRDAPRRTAVPGQDFDVFS
jgi:hypothetical protein